MAGLHVFDVELPEEDFPLDPPGVGRAAEGKRYADAAPWRLETPIPDGVADRVVESCTPGVGPRLVFSALDASVAGDLERAFADAGHVVLSNARNHRMDPVVPLLVPEVNAGHLALLKAQARLRGGKGAIVTNPNCSTVVLTIALRALHDVFGLRRGFLVSLQAISGAGYPGVAALDITDNVVPYIGGEEEKVEMEPRKMLGQLDGGAIRLAGFQLSAHTNRVAVTDGHLVCASLEFERAPSPEAAVEVLRGFQPPAGVRGLPSAPDPAILVSSAPDRPQPRRDRDAGRGMATVIGRVRPDPLFHLKFVVLSHNTIRGAAGGALLNAELLCAQGYLAG